MRRGYEIRSRDLAELKWKEWEMFADSLKGGRLGEVIQANKVPLTLIGIGVAWLVASNTGLADRLANDERVQAARRRIGEFAGDIGIGGGSSDGAGLGEGFGRHARGTNVQRRILTGLGP